MACLKRSWRLKAVAALGVGSIVSSVLADAGVTLRSEMNDPSRARGELYTFWDVHNRLPPYTSVNVPALGKKGAKINCVRMLGGWGSEDVSVDAYKWDGEKYVYDWEALKQRIDVVLDSGVEMYQIVLDNPPWAFQHGLTFVEENDGIHYLAKDRNATYGNSVPPNDPEAWGTFIEEMMKEMARSYGRDIVENWRFRVGTEIDTRPGHWSGTMEQFFEHYRITSNAVWSVLPEAKVGVQFREATHFKDYVDYTGNVEGPYGVAFIEWAAENKVRYDFMGVSFYPIYTNPMEVDMEYAYTVEFAPMMDHPLRRKGTPFEIHEYSAMAQIKNGNFVWLSNSYDAAYFANLAKMVYEKGIAKVHQWRKSSYDLHTPEVLTKAALDTMVGKIRFANTVEGEPEVEGNIIEGIFARSEDARELDALIFNYNVDPEYREAEVVSLELETALPTGSQYRYRVATYGKEQCAFQRFAEDYPKARIEESAGGWVLDGISPNGQPLKSLNAEGNAVLESVDHRYLQYNELQWSDWKEGTTTARSADAGGSAVFIGTQLPSFAIQKFEIRFLDTLADAKQLVYYNDEHLKWVKEKTRPKSLPSPKSRSPNTHDSSK